MRDQFERNINYMRVSVTDRCNLRCVYCMPKDGVQQISHDEILTFDEIARVCRIGAELGISRIKLTGGRSCRDDLPDSGNRAGDADDKRNPVKRQIACTQKGWNFCG